MGSSRKICIRGVEDITILSYLSPGQSDFSPSEQRVLPPRQASADPRTEHIYPLDKAIFDDFLLPLDIISSTRGVRTFFFLEEPNLTVYKDESIKPPEKSANQSIFLKISFNVTRLHRFQ